MREDDRMKLAASCYQLYTAGKSMAEIGRLIGLSYHTIRKYLLKYYGIKHKAKDTGPRPAVCDSCGRPPTKRDQGELTRIRVGSKYAAYFDNRHNKKIKVIHKGTVKYLCSRPGCLLPTVAEDDAWAIQHVSRQHNKMEVSAEQPTQPAL